MPKNQQAIYAKTLDADEAKSQGRLRSPYSVQIHLKATGSTQRARGYGCHIHIINEETGANRRFLFCGGKDKETLPATALRGAVESLDLLLAMNFGGATVTIFSDNPNLISACAGFGHRWREKGWKTATGETTKNSELVGLLLDHMDKAFAVEALFRLPEKSRELRLSEVLALTGRVTPQNKRLEEIVSLAVAA